MKKLVPLGAFLLLVAALATLLIVKPSSRPEFTPAPLPALALKALDGKTLWRQESLAGKVVLLNFFASWCTPCEAEMPELAALAKRYPALRMQGIAWNDDPVTLRAWLEKHGNPFGAVWIDPKGDATMALGLKGVPETLIVDAAGVVRYRLTGPVTKAVLERDIEPLLKTLTEAADVAP